MGYVNSDNLSISSYLDKPEKPNPNDEAFDWMEKTGYYIITDTDDLDELENDWINFNGMIKKWRMVSDWKSIELFGCTNQEHYEKLKAKALMYDINNFIDDINNFDLVENSLINESTYDDINDVTNYYTVDNVNYTSLDVEKAKKWAEESGMPIIIPTRTLAELESIWDSYNMLILKHRRESDWASYEYFGLTNLRHYEYLKTQFLRQDIDEKDINEFPLIESVTTNDTKNYLKSICKNQSISDSTKALLEFSTPKKNISEEVITSNILSDVINTCYGSLSSMPSNFYDGDMPYYTPEEMIDMGVFNTSNPEYNFYGEISDNDILAEDVSVCDWFRYYCDAKNGFTEMFSSVSSLWVNKIKTLMHELSKLSISGNTELINSKKQSILELGWNPDIEFSEKNRIIANESNMLNYYDFNTKFIDLTEFYKTISNRTLFSENSDDRGHLYPIYVVLTEGKTYFSNIIKAVTHSNYSHASISFDNKLDNMHSFSMEDSEGKRGGYRKENIHKLPMGCIVRVYSFFVPIHIWMKMKNFVDDISKNEKNTKYSFSNFLSVLFNIKINKDYDMICSQFVDRCLKVADIDITNKDSSCVTPEDINRNAKKNRKIYTVYKGLASEYDENKVKNIELSLSKNAKLLKENNINFSSLTESKYITKIINNIYNLPIIMEMKDYMYLVESGISKTILDKVLFENLTIEPYFEAKSFPVEFDNDGNLLIKNLKKIDYESEYAKSHKLLKEYRSAKNTKGMKYELSKLWMMLCMIEDTLHSKKFDNLPSIAIQSSAEVRAKAKITNDFNFYMKELMRIEPGFNFTEYYDSTPFSSAYMKISSGTLKFFGGLIKNFIKPI